MQFETLRREKKSQSPTTRANLLRSDASTSELRLGLTVPVPPASSDQVEANDVHRVQIDHFDSSIGNASIVRNTPGDELAACHPLSKLFKEEYDVSVGVRLARLYHNVFQVCISHGDQARARTFARLADENRVVCDGEASPLISRMRRFMARPKRQPTQGGRVSRRRWYRKAWMT